MFGNDLTTHFYANVATFSLLFTFFLVLFGHFLNIVNIENKKLMIVTDS